jgi:ABC-type dipeptide/oligopeptide/nickel transport system permease subunit
MSSVELDVTSAAERSAALPLPSAESYSGGETPQPTAWWRSAGRVFVQNKLAVASLSFLIFIVLFCFVGPHIYSTNQVAANLLLENEPPSATHLLGTTPAGRDELGRLMVGGQSTLFVGIGVGVLATGFGLLWGMIAGFVGGILDSIMMRIVDALLSIPFLFFVVLLAALITPTLPLIIVVIAAVSWLSTARLARGEALSLRTREYVEAAEVAGGSRHHTMIRHIAPNLLGIVVVNGTLKVADAILIFASISFLGLGVPPPATNWGAILTAGVNNLFDGYWWQLWPAGLLIVLTVLAVNVLGDALADVVEIRLQTR